MPGIGTPASTQVKSSGLAPTDPRVNSSIVLSQSDNVVATTKTLTKVINGNTYTRTLSYNASGQFLSATVWS